MDGLVEESRNYIGKALRLRLSCCKSLISYMISYDITITWYNIIYNDIND